MTDQQIKSDIKESKYTVKEVLASLYWDTKDSDEDIDGYLHIVSTINGMEIKIALKDIIKN